MATKNEVPPDSEVVFLNDNIRHLNYWKKRVVELEKDNRDATVEREYAEAYRLLINQFTQVDTKDEK